MTGKQLVRILRDSGTGETGLTVARKLLGENPLASAAQVIRALKKDNATGEANGGEVRRVGLLTIEKAEQIARDGKYIPPPPKKIVPIEDEPDAPDDEDTAKKPPAAARK